MPDWELERRQPSFKALGAIKEALEGGGVDFTNGNKPGVRLVGALGPAGIELGENGSVTPTS